MFNNFIDFKKAFDKVWQTGLWQVLRSFYNIEKGLVQAIQVLCSPLEQSARGVLQDNNRSLSWMLAFTQPVQLVLREDNGGHTS